MADFIQRFTAKSYGCLKDVTVALTPLHAFIGPNDSGKSTLLRAVRALMDLSWGAAPMSSRGIFGINGTLEATYSDGLGYGVSLVPHEKTNAPKPVETARGAQLTILRERIVPARMLRLDPDALRQGSDIIPRGRPIEFRDEHGLGLPGVYDAILNQDFEAFGVILADVRRLFASVKKLGLENIGGPQKALEITLADGTTVGTEHMSEGLLYYLAFAALRFLGPTSVVLIEEPENGLHPARIGDVMRVLREVSRTTQILLATHSPLVINELEPEEVSVVTRDPETGTKVTPLRETANFEKRSSVYALGELWLSFADGVQEAPLLQGRQPS